MNRLVVRSAEEATCLWELQIHSWIPYWRFRWTTFPHLCVVRKGSRRHGWLKNIWGTNCKPYRMGGGTGCIRSTHYLLLKREVTFHQETYLMVKRLKTMDIYHWISLKRLFDLFRSDLANSLGVSLSLNVESSSSSSPATILERYFRFGPDVWAFWAMRLLFVAKCLI